MRTTLLSLAMLAAVATAANADINVWWQLEGGDGLVEQQGQGQTLVISTGHFPLNTEYFEFQLSMWIATDGTGGTTNGCTGYASNLWRGPDTTITMQGNPMNGLLNPLNWTGTKSGGSQNEGFALIMNYGRRRGSAQESVIGGSFSPVKVIEMTMRWNRPIVDFWEQVSIHQSVSTGLCGYLPSTGNKVFFGSNTWVYGNTAVNTFAEASDTEEPVITVIGGIPEPSALVLLSLGTSILLRWR